MKRVAVAKAILPVRLHVRTDLHLARKVWHMGMGLFAAFLYMSGLSQSSAILILGSFLGGDLLLETARLRIPAFNEKLMRFWGPIMRSSEVNRFSAIPHYIAATLLAVAIFPKPVAVLSILYLACGDPIASLVGILYGHHSVRLKCGKSVIGTGAGVATCAIVTFLFLKTLSLPDSSVLAITLVGGIAGGTAELIPLDLDDNFTIPIISGFMVWLAFMIFGV